jgi:hypothetical protein
MRIANVTAAPALSARRRVPSSDVTGPTVVDTDPRGVR